VFQAFAEHLVAGVFRLDVSPLGSYKPGSSFRALVHWTDGISFRAQAAASSWGYALGADVLRSCPLRWNTAAGGRRGDRIAARGVWCAAARPARALFRPFQDSLDTRRKTMEAEALGVRRHGCHARGPCHVRLREAGWEVSAVLVRMLCSVELMAAAERMGLEGVVSKRRDAPNRSGTKCGWV